jgi:hypothetical protein
LTNARSANWRRSSPSHCFHSYPSNNLPRVSGARPKPYVHRSIRTIACASSERTGVSPRDIPCNKSLPFPPQKGRRLALPFTYIAAKRWEDVSIAAGLRDLARSRKRHR